MKVFTSTSVHDDDLITVSGPTPDDDAVVTIVFGDSNLREQLTIDFDDPATLDRLAALASEGARALRAVLVTAESDDEPAAPVTS